MSFSVCTRKLCASVAFSRRTIVKASHRQLSRRSLFHVASKEPEFLSNVSGNPSRRVPSSNRYATSVTPHSSSIDPAEVEALKCLEEGTIKLEEGDVQAAKDLYKRSVEIKRNASSLFNLGVTYYHLKDYDQAITAWKESIALQPSSPDAHTNLASAYIISPVSRPDLALHHLEVASSLSPEDPEIAFNHAAVLEATGRLEEALERYKLSKQYGVERAAVHIRNIGAKIFGKQLGNKAEAEESKN